MNEKEMKELTADVVAIVKREREAQAPKYGSFYGKCCRCNPK